MNPPVNRTLLRHELRRLLWNRVTLAQVLYTHAVILFVALTTALAEKTSDPGLWTSYTLFYGLGVALMFNNISGGYLFVRPKMARAMDAVLVSPLSPGGYVASSALACFIFNIVNFVLHMILVLALRHPGLPGAGLVPASIAALSAGAMLLLALARFTLTSKEPGQGQIVMMLLTIGTLVAGSLTAAHLKPSAGYLWAVAAVSLAALSIAWRAAIGTLGREEVVLS